MFSVFGISFNYIDIAVIALLLLSVFIGYAKGFAATIINFIRFSVGLFLCFYLSNNLSPVLYDSFIKERVLASMTQKIEAAGVEGFLTEASQTIERLPAFLTASIDLSVLSASSENVANIVLLNIVEPLVISALKIVVYIIVFLLFFVATGLIILLVKKNSKRREEKRGHISKLKRADKIVGAFVGVLDFAVLVLAFEAIARYAAGMNTDGNAFLDMVQGSAVLDFISGINPFNAVTEGLV